MEREAFLARIRERLDDAPPAPAVEVPPDWSVTIEDPIARFRTELEAVAGLFHRAPAADATSVLGDIVRDVAGEVGEGGPSVLVAPEDGVPDGLEEVVVAAGGVVKRWPEAGRDEAADARVGVTSALWAVAETGSVVVSSRPPGGRAPSLLPPIHVAFVPVDRLLATTEQLFKEIERLEPRPSNVVVITGPSKSADIGMELARGVHGPGEVHVVLTE